MPDPKYFTEFFRIPLAKFLRCPAVSGGVLMVKDLSLNLIDSFPCFYIFYDYSIQPEMKNGYFMSAPYTLYLAHKAMGIFYIIYRCHHESFLACLHSIDPHCHKPHQQAFFCQQIGLVYLFNYLYDVF